MKIYLILGAIIILGFAIAVKKNQSVSESAKEILSENPEVIEENKIDATPTFSESPTSFPNSPTFQKSGMESYKYPGAKVINFSDREILMQSFDDPDVITNWYRSIIQNQNLNVKTFVTTKTNDNVLNKLVGVSQEFEIEVVIEKKSGENIIRISIELR